jgi:MinD superfamily P-loop ATPase
VIAAIQESDYCLLVTEPTPFGLHDLTLSVDVLKKMDIPFGVIINRSDLGDGETEAFCLKENIPILMKIPFSREIAQWYSKGISMLEGDRDYREKFLSVFEKITGQIARRIS